MARRGRLNPPDAEEAEALWRSAWSAYEEGRLADAFAACEGGLLRDPRSGPLHHLLGLLHLEREEPEAAQSALEASLALEPDVPEVMLSYADLLVSSEDDGDGGLERGVTLARRAQGLTKTSGVERPEELLAELKLVEGVGLSQLGFLQEALSCFDAVLETAPASLEARLERGLVLFELCRFDAAQAELAAVLERAEDAWAHHTLGMIAERRGEAVIATRHFQAASALAPDQFHPPVHISDAEFDAALAGAMDKLAPDVRVHLSNTTIAVEPFPSEEDLLASHPPLSPSMLGLFRGTPVGERSVLNAFDHFPNAIVLYQRNLERAARTKDELVEQIGVTLRHEVGHLVGLDEDELRERGLE